MKRPRWIAFTAQDGHSIGLDSEGRGFELRAGELHRVPDPPAADRRTATRQFRNRKKRNRP